MIPFFFRNRNDSFKSKLFDEIGFYDVFISDLQQCKQEAIIESPYITASRMELLYPGLKDLLRKKVKIHIITRDPVEHEEFYRHQATNEILTCHEMGINTVMLRGYHHRKLAIIDRKILWEGSLNILSQSRSMEIMRRIEGKEWAEEMFRFTGLGRLI
ncbi:hypothetical protein A3F59_01995 [Candidatus Roizmanbacteria bacterium RIFCSPHIGHO2_12_FULL_38_13]|nr:MAG: hypothetical protein A2905_03835 [Candidatus Levybacteria bacterium RIFCSPLOWO2_01_FULL_36_10]OGK35691.1 MAG: hypothetical protein A3F59_01995 [Candidatus Roizmanbacteria bacterium RIFCSPHIGHO2_12_FULL_38_13]